MTNIMTPAALVIALHALGYEMTARRLTDWRVKRLLPSLALKSRGRGKGVLRFWKEADILRRAVAICNRFQAARRQRKQCRVSAVLQTMGFSDSAYPIALVRRACEKELSRKAEVNWAATPGASGEIARAINYTPVAISDVLAEIQNMMSKVNYEAGKNVDISILVDVANKCLKAIFKGSKINGITAGMLAEALAEIKCLISPAGVYQRLTAATDEEFSLARDRYISWWNRLDHWVNKLDSILAILPGKNQTTPGVLPSNTLAATFAPLGIALLLPLK
jgi:hypothetical protein